MANLTFTDLQNETFAHLGLDSTDSTNQSNVKRWLNYVQQDIHARWPWPWMYGREAIATIPDYTTGTVSINSGSTSLTGSGTTFTSLQGDGTYYIQFDNNANDWYNVTAQVSATALTLGLAFQGTTNLTNSTYTLRKFFYSLSSQVDEVLDCRNWNTPVKLIAVDFRTIDLINPLVQSNSPAYGYMMFGVDANGNQVFSPYPFPNDARLFEFRIKKRPTDMVNPGDSPSIPNKYAHLISWGANAIGFEFLRKNDFARDWSVKFEQRIDQMKKEYRQWEDYQPVLQSIDTVNRTRWVQMPTNYPVINS